MYRKPSFESGEPVEQIVFNLERSCLFLGITPLLFSASIYLALIPNKVTFSSLANSKSISSFFYIGKPSKSKIVSPAVSVPTSQFHIIHPQVVK